MFVINKNMASNILKYEICIKNLVRVTEFSLLSDLRVAACPADVSMEQEVSLYWEMFNLDQR